MNKEGFPSSSTSFGSEVLGGTEPQANDNSVGENDGPIENIEELKKRYEESQRVAIEEIEGLKRLGISDEEIVAGLTTRHGVSEETAREMLYSAELARQRQERGQKGESSTKKSIEDTLQAPLPVVTEQAKNQANKAHKNEKKSFSDIAKKVVATVMLTVTLAATVLGVVDSASHNSSSQPDRQSAGIVNVVDEVKNKFNELQANTGETAEVVGIKDGYGEFGMWESNNKPTQYAFGSAVETAEVCNNDAKEMVKYAADNEVEAMASYMAHLPESLQPDGFKGLSIKETEQRLENMDPSEYEKIQKLFNDIIDDSTASKVTTDGSYNSARIRRIDDNGKNVHENMEAVNSITDATGLTVAELSWKDESGNEIGSMKILIIYDENGNVIGGCIQPIEKEEGSGIYEGMDEVEDLPVVPVVPTPEPSPQPEPEPEPSPQPEPEPEPSPQPEPSPKDQKEANENSGANKGIVTPEKQEREITPEPVADETHSYNQETNTYDYTPEEQAAQIGYEVENDIKEVGQESAPITAPEEVAAAEEMVESQTAPEMVTGTQQGAEGEAGEANNFDAGATVGTGEVTGNTLSADESGNTIQENLENATGNEEVNPTGDYSQGF